MLARGMQFGWRRVLSAAAPATVMLAATLAAGGTAALAHIQVSTEQPETTALIARMTVAPSVPRRALIDQLIAGLKADGVWAKLDWLVLAAAHDAQAGRLNWCSAKALTAINAPAFTVDRGYAGDGAMAYLDAGEAFGAGGMFTLNAGSVGIWINAQGAVTGQRSVIRASGSGGLTYIAAAPAGMGEGSGVNQGGSTARTSTSSRAGHRAVSRTGPGALGLFLNGTKEVTATNAATSVSLGSVYLLRFCDDLFGRSGGRHLLGRAVRCRDGGAALPAG